MNKITNILNKYKNIPIEAKASLWYSISNIIQKGIAFFVIPIYTRLLTAAQYGEYAVFQSWCNIIIIFATLNLYCGVFTKAMVDYPTERDKYTASMQGLTSVIAILVFSIFIGIQRITGLEIVKDKNLIVLMFYYFVTYSAYMFWTTKQRVEYKYKFLVFITIIVAVFTPIVSILLISYFDNKSKAIILGFLIAQSVVGTFFYIYQFIKGKSFYIKEYWIKALKFNIPLIPHYLALIVLGQSDRIMITNYCGAKEAGIYTLAFQVSMAMSIFVNAVNNSFVPWTYDKLKNYNILDINKISSQLCKCIALLSFIVMLIAPEIVLLLGGKEYWSAVYVIPAIASSIFFTFCYNLFCNIEFYYNKTQYVMLASSIAACANILLNYIALPLFGFIVAGYTTVFCYILLMGIHYYFMRNITRNKFGGNNIYNIKQIILESILLLILSCVAMLLYNTYEVRLFLISIIAIVIYIKRRKIYLLLNNKQN